MRKYAKGLKDIADLYNIKLGSDTSKKGEGLKILTNKQMLYRLPILPALIQAGNNSKSLKNELRQILYSLYRSKVLTKTVYNNLMKSIRAKHYIYKMETFFMNSKNSKTNEPNRFKYDLVDKLDLKNPNKNMALVNLSIYYTWKNVKSTYNNNKFKISQILIDPNTINNRIAFKIKSGYKLELIGYNKNCVQYESKGDKILSIQEYLALIEKYLRELINKYKNEGEWKIQLIAEINFISLKPGSDETRVIYTRSDNEEFMNGDDTDEVIKSLFKSFLQRFEENLQEKMRVSDFEFDGINFFYYNFNKRVYIEVDHT